MRIGPWFLCLALLLSLPDLSDGADTDLHEVVAYKQVGGVTLHLQVFRPTTSKGEARLPALVFFHGGGWKGGTAEQFFPFAKYFSSRGMVGISVEYRLILIHHTTPFEAVADARSAMRWIRANAAKLGVDPTRLIAAGGSAGGQLAAATVFARSLDDRADDLETSPMPQALVLFNPVLDCGPGGVGYNFIGKRYHEFSPLHNITRAMPPTIIFQGTADKTVRPEAAKKFTETMRDAGVRCDLHLYPEQPHGFYVFKPEGNPYYQRVVQETDRFLNSLGYLSGQPTMPNAVVPEL